MFYFVVQSESMMRRRRKTNPMEEAIQFCLHNKDKNGFEIRFINDFKGRGVFSCSEFERGVFLLEYRGDLISKEECERRQRIYHNALKVFMFEFRFNGKFFCVDAARDDGSLGRLVNDDDINPNCRMKTIRVDGKPHLCLFAIRSICPGEEITYNYGDSEWPWRCKLATVKKQWKPQDTATKKMGQVSLDSADCDALTVVLDKTSSEVQHTMDELNTLSQSEVRDEMDDSVSMDLSVCTPVKELEKVTLEKSQLSLEKQDCVEKKGGEKMSPVKEQLVNTEQSFCAPTEILKQVTLEKSQLSLEKQDCVEKKVGEKVCRHDVISSAISSLDKCAVCVGPVVAFKWIGL
ncbi:histone-lysine N-methyltransferase SETD5 isoform X3 [Triplophysa rosa]|uniref:N-lysine methyltransferase SETD8-like n=1 Tax=Triplophysa rosa TaxID=992332 RepID=A0A9W7TL61_TRIRA|nr:histone-lysine N-methyltransferase SETD5 isoform X3 [Triplophysa rosa]KAI7798716.1 putative N-lysine methyltransferase SETD8-like [Triplophysa rosa]